MKLNHLMSTAIFCCAMLTTVCSSCSKDEETTPPTPTETTPPPTIITTPTSPFIGQWYTTDYSGDKSYFNFFAVGSYTYSRSNGTIFVGGSWQYNNDLKSLAISKEYNFGYPSSGTETYYVIAYTESSFTISKGDDIVTYNKSKESNYDILLNGVWQNTKSSSLNEEFTFNNSSKKINYSYYQNNDEGEYVKINASGTYSLYNNKLTVTYSSISYEGELDNYSVFNKNDSPPKTVSYTITLCDENNLTIIKVSPVGPYTASFTKKKI